MTQFYRLTLLAVFFVFAIGPPVFAQKPKVLKLSEVQFGIEAIGFSVFRGVESQRFDVELRGVSNRAGYDWIVVRTFGGPMETLLDKIGGAAGMSGSPVFVGDCDSVNNCSAKAAVAGNDVFFVGALSMGVSALIEDGPNALLTPAEYMLGERSGGYSAASQFSIYPPDRIMIDGREYKSLMLFNDINDSLSLQRGGSSTQCDESIKSEIKPGSMISVFLARGTIDLAGSGTVTWVDGDRVYAFGHPFFGTGMVSYPFSQVSVVDTVQSTLDSYKIVGCRLTNKGVITVDGMFEISGVIGRQARMLPYQVELRIGNNLVVFNEEIADSPLALAIITQLPVIWAQQMLGDTSYISVAYQTKVAVMDQPEIFMESIMPVQVVKHPLVEVFARINAALEKLRSSGFSYNLESIKTHVDFIRGIGVWTAKESFLSQKTVAPGETVHVNVVLEERSSGAVRQVSIPVKAPEDFADRVTPWVLPEISVVIQSASKFVEQTGQKDIVSLRDIIQMINESANRKTSILYVQEIMPLTKTERETKEANSKAAVQPDWSWVELDQGALRRLPRPESTEVVLTTTPELYHFIDFDETFTVRVDLSSQPVDLGADDMEEKKKKRWFEHLKFW